MTKLHAQAVRIRSVHTLERASDALRDAKRLVVLTGAGVSTESGIPDFRSAGGVWDTFDPEDFAYERFLDDPRGFWELRARLMEVLDLDNAAANAAHEAIARASASPRFLGHVTQNIDGLFARAGHVDDKLVEVHGSARTVRCIACDAWFGYEVAAASVARGALPPPCPTCAGALKPGTVLFGEMLPQRALSTGETWMRAADAVLVVGSSLVVYPVAALPDFAVERGAMLVVVNDQPTRLDAHADAVIRAKAGDVVPRMLADAGFV